MNRIRTGVLGLDALGRQTLDALRGHEHIDIVAVADRRSEQAEELASEFDARFYDDNRQLIVQEELDLLVLCIPTYQCLDCIRWAAKEGIHVFKLSPLGRNLPEAQTLVEVMAAAGLQFQVGAARRFAPGYLEAYKHLKNNELGKVYTIQVEYFENYDGPWEYRADPVLAGGGVLLERAYGLLDVLAWCHGVPEKIYALKTGFCSKRVTPPYRTEDTVALTLSYSDGSMGALLAGWMAGPPRESLRFYGVEGSIDVGVNHFNFYRPDGTEVRSFTYNVDEAWLVRQQIRQLADSLLNEEVKPLSVAKEHLQVIGMTDAAYLSCRTGLPEPIKEYGTL